MLSINFDECKVSIIALKLKQIDSKSILNPVKSSFFFKLEIFWPKKLLSPFPHPSWSMKVSWWNSAYHDSLSDFIQRTSGLQKSLPGYSERLSKAEFSSSSCDPNLRAPKIAANSFSHWNGSRWNFQIEILREFLLKLKAALKAPPKDNSFRTLF